MSKSSTGSRPDAPDTSTRWIDDFGALDVTQKLVAETVPFVRALDQPGHVSNDKAPIAAHGHDAEIRGQRRERDSRQSWARGGNAGDERGLARVGKADQADVRQQLQLQPQMSLFARLAGLVLARCAVGGGREVRVAKPAASALGDQHSLTRHRQVRELFGRSWYLGIVQDDERADRHLDFEVFAVASRSQRALTLSAALRPRTPGVNRKWTSVLR